MDGRIELDPVSEATTGSGAGHDFRADQGGRHTIGGREHLEAKLHTLSPGLRVMVEPAAASCQ